MIVGATDRMRIGATATAIAADDISTAPVDGSAAPIAVVPTESSNGTAAPTTVAVADATAPTTTGTNDIAIVVGDCEVSSRTMCLCMLVILYPYVSYWKRASGVPLATTDPNTMSFAVRLLLSLISLSCRWLCVDVAGSVGTVSLFAV